MYSNEIRVDNGYFTKFYCQSDQLVVSSFDTYSIQFSGDEIFRINGKPYSLSGPKEIKLNARDNRESGSTIGIFATAKPGDTFADQKWMDNEPTWTTRVGGLYYLFEDYTLGNGNTQSYKTSPDEEIIHELTRNHNVLNKSNHLNWTSIAVPDKILFYIDNGPLIFMQSNENSQGKLFVFVNDCDIEVLIGNANSQKQIEYFQNTTAYIEINSTYALLQSHTGHTEFVGLHNCDLTLESASDALLYGSGTMNNTFTQETKNYTIDNQSIHIKSRDESIIMTASFDYTDKENIYMKTKISGVANDLMISGISLFPSFLNWLMDNAYTLPTVIAAVIFSSVGEKKGVKHV